MLVLLQPNLCRHEDKVVFQEAKPETDNFPAKIEIKLRQLVSADKIGLKTFILIFKNFKLQPSECVYGGVWLRYTLFHY